MTIIELNDAKDFESLVKMHRKCVIKFWADWCKYCHLLDKVIDSVASSNSDVMLLKVNVDAFRDIAKEYSVSTLPTMLFIKDGSIKQKIVGSTDASTLLETLEDLN